MSSELLFWRRARKAKDNSYSLNAKFQRHFVALSIVRRSFLVHSSAPPPPLTSQCVCSADALGVLHLDARRRKRSAEPVSRRDKEPKVASLLSRDERLCEKQEGKSEKTREISLSPPADEVKSLTLIVEMWVKTSRV